jgi:ferredoxin like protein
MAQFGSVTERLDGNHFEPDEEKSHIEVSQAAVKATGAGPLLVRICPYPRGGLGISYREG